MAKLLKTHHIFPVAILPVSKNFVSDVNFLIRDNASLEIFALLKLVKQVELSIIVESRQK